MASYNKSNNVASQRMAKVSSMEKILNNPGLQHLAEKIFWNLDCEDLEACEEINESAKDLLDNPIFWLWKCVQKGLSKENHKDWAKAILLMKNSVMKRNIVLFLKWNLKKSGVVDLPCYTSPIVQDDFRNKIWKSCKSVVSSIENTEIVKILAPLTDNPNAPDENGWTPIHEAALNGHTEIVKILTPLTNNPNAPNNNGRTPIQDATNVEICRILKACTIK